MTGETATMDRGEWWRFDKSKWNEPRHGGLSFAAMAVVKLLLPAMQDGGGEGKQVGGEAGSGVAQRDGSESGHWPIFIGGNDGR